MSTGKRLTKGGVAYHVLNRANGRLRIFKKEQDFAAFENILSEGIERFNMRLCGYCIMGNHWHLLLWPVGDGEMPDFMQWITATHAKRWHAAHGTTGIGHIYQGCYKSFPIQHNWHYLKTMLYIENNPVRAGITESAGDWEWSSYACRLGASKPFELIAGPLPIPEDWVDIVRAGMPEKDNVQLANCIKRGCPYGEEDWVIKTAKDLKLESTLRKRGRPRKLA